MRKQEEGARRRRKMREERDQGLKRGRGINALFELCKIAAWERRGVCVCVRLSMSASV